VPPGAVAQQRQRQKYREDRARHTVSLGTSQLKRTSVPRDDLLGDPKPEAGSTNPLVLKNGSKSGSPFPRSAMGPPEGSIIGEES
jgi:hypothetical protein